MGENKKDPSQVSLRRVRISLWIHRYPRYHSNCMAQPYPFRLQQALCTDAACAEDLTETVQVFGSEGTGDTASFYRVSTIPGSLKNARRLVLRHSLLYKIVGAILTSSVQFVKPFFCIRKYRFPESIPSLPKKLQKLRFLCEIYNFRPVLMAIFPYPL